MFEVACRLSIMLPIVQPGIGVAADKHAVPRQPAELFALQRAESTVDSASPAFSHDRFLGPWTDGPP
jgi:hypothetical protein